MKIIISHRANLSGPNKELENHPSQIQYALQAGFEVEIDVWRVDNKWILGHNQPQYEVPPEFLFNEKFWLHAKTPQTLYHLLKHPAHHLFNCFSHDVDACVLTSHNYIWTYPSIHNILIDRSIAVLPELVEGWEIEKALGVCSDFPIEYKKKLCL